MIISASRRTDIPAFYSEWFFNRLEEGYVITRNPMNRLSLSRIVLTHEAVDGIVFWTKNPGPMLGRLDSLDKYIYYFQFTLNPYDKDIEQGLPDKDILIDSFRKISESIGRERVIWRYDPVLLNEKYSVKYHMDSFKALAGSIAPYTEKCTLSFLDYYAKIRSQLQSRDIYSPSETQREDIVCGFSEIARDMGIYLDMCAEPGDFTKFGVTAARCIDAERLKRLGAKNVKELKDKNQRPECGCARSVDIGAYNTCLNGCIYCYANSGGRAEKNYAAHDVQAPVIIGELRGDERIRERNE